MSAPLESTPRSRFQSAIGWAGFIAGYLAAYFLSTAMPTPLLWYYPLEHRFALETRPGGLAADFYGRLVLALASGLVASLLARAAAGRAGPGREIVVLRTLAIWCATLLLFTAGLYVYLLVGRLPFPVALPPDYTPR